MKTQVPCLSQLFGKHGFLPETPKAETDLQSLQLKMLRIQQGIWHQKRRAVIVFEGFDAAGKGGAIRRLAENLDPRGFQVHGIGPPAPDEQARHYLYRFWTKVPEPGTIAIFDRSWYGRVLVERVERLAPKERLRAAYREINEFEAMLVDDGVDVMKIFLAIDKREQLRRFEQRLRDPYKHWKLGEADVEARAKWGDYIRATDKMFELTHTRRAPWRLIPANDKRYAREATLEAVTRELAHHGKWMEGTARTRHEMKSLKTALRKLGLKKGSIK